MQPGRSKAVGNIFIGTSNITLPGPKKTFPEAYQSRSRLHYYSSLFNTLEVNISFYKSPLFSTYLKWAMDTPEDFQFSVKLSKEITHAKDPGDDPGLVAEFLDAAAGLGTKKGCLLVQFPGKITLDYFNQTERILAYIRQVDKSWKKAIEFRHASWYVGETFELLNEHQAALVLHDIPKGRVDTAPDKSPFIYIRFHGPSGDYRGSYTESALQKNAKAIRKWSEERKDVYAYFNNTIGSAFENARYLQTQL